MGEMRRVVSANHVRASSALTHEAASQQRGTLPA